MLKQYKADTVKKININSLTNLTYNIPFTIVLTVKWLSLIDHVTYSFTYLIKQPNKTKAERWTAVIYAVLTTQGSSVIRMIRDSQVNVTPDTISHIIQRLTAAEAKACYKEWNTDESITLIAISSCISTAFSRSSFWASHTSCLGSQVNGSRWTLSRSTMVNRTTDRSSLSRSMSCLSRDSSDLDHDKSSLLTSMLLTELHNQNTLLLHAADLTNNSSQLSHVVRCL